jgi:SAM-dependent methyltransferase
MRDALEESIQSARPILAASCRIDTYLAGVAARYPSHRLLASAAGSLYQRQVDFLARLLRERYGAEQGPIRILDWGCGRGHVSYLLKRAGFAVTTCDLAAIRDASRHSAFRKKQLPIIDEHEISVVPLEHPSTLPFPADTFHAVCSFGVLEHVEDDLASMQMIRRVLKPGGLFFIAFLPYQLSWTQHLSRLLGRPAHDRLYAERDLRALAHAADFRVAALWHGQFFAKRSRPPNDRLEWLDRFITDRTPLRYLATNLEAILVAS